LGWRLWHENTLWGLDSELDSELDSKSYFEPDFEPRWDSGGSRRLLGCLRR
jgi:hypothetical protein